MAVSGLLLLLVLLGSEGLVCCLHTAKKQMSQTNRSIMMPDEVCKWPCILSVNSSYAKFRIRKHRSKAKKDDRFLHDYKE